MRKFGKPFKVFLEGVDDLKACDVDILYCTRAEMRFSITQRYQASFRTFILGFLLRPLSLDCALPCLRSRHE